MRRWRAILAIIGAILLALSAWELNRTSVPHRTIVLSAGECRTPITVIDPTEGSPLGSIIVFHGLSANRRVMQSLGDDLAADGSLRAYLVDLPGHGDNTGRFSFARARQCATAVVETLIRAGTIDPKTTALLGHSMGAAIAIRMADLEPVAATVAISPAPMIPPRRMPANLLVLSGQYDMWPLKREARRLREAAGGERTKADDFLQQRAFDLEVVPHATHTSLIFNSQVERDSLDWIENSLEAAAHDSAGVFDWNNRQQWEAGEEDESGPRAEVAGILDAFAGVAPKLGLIGILLIFPFTIAVAARLTGPARAELPGTRPTRALAIVEGAVCALAAVLILTLVVPLKFVHLYTGGYLASLLLIVGLLLLVLNHRDMRECASFRGPMRLIVAAALGFAAMLALGAWMNWQLTDMWLNAPRWMRFAALVPVAWIFCFAEEVVLGPVGEGQRRAARFGVFLLLRLELWLACGFAVLRLASGQVLVPLLVVPLAVFSILQRLGTDSFRRRTGSATAAALFGAILAAWFIAAIFPLS
ncbi:MAG: alpha/beta hydrolase [Candidatus Acidiferrales bacterium]